jgi:recombination protein RecT
MSTEELKNALNDKPKMASFPSMLEQYKPEIAKALPKHLNADRMARIALTAFRRNPKLGECNPRSIFAAIIQASQLGLEPDTLGRSFLIPYKQECQFVPGWKGLMDLMNRSGAATAWTGAVFEGDEFEYALGDSPFLRHKPGDEFDPEYITHVYAIGRVVGATWPVVEVWTKKRVVKHRDRFNKVGRMHYSFQHFEMYARKVVLLQVLKYLPASFELSAAVALNDAAETGSQGLTVRDAIDGTWVPVCEDEYQTPDPEADIPEANVVPPTEPTKTTKPGGTPKTKTDTNKTEKSGF